MKMKVNWKKWATVFVLLEIALLCSGCTPSWIGVAEGLLPGIATALNGLISFILALEGKTIPPSVSAAIQKIVADIQTELGNVLTLIQAVNTGGATVLQKIQTAMNTILANLQSILSGLSISDPATLQKITEWVGLAVTAVEAILAIIPMAIKKLAEKPSEKQLRSLDADLHSKLTVTHKTMQSTYKEIVTTPTGTAVVDEALGKVVPQTI